MNEEINREDHIWFCGNKALLTGENNIYYQPNSILCRYDSRFNGENGGKVKGSFRIFNHTFYLIILNGGHRFRNFVVHENDVIKKCHSSNIYRDEIKYSIFFKFWIYLRFLLFKKYPKLIKVNTFFYDGFRLKAFKNIKENK